MHPMVRGDTRAPLKGIVVYEAPSMQNPYVQGVLLNISRTSFDTLGFILQTPRLVIKAISSDTRILSDKASLQ